MKIKTKKVEVKEEAYTYEEVTYECDAKGCEFTTTDEEDSKAHYAKNHSFLNKQEAGGYTFLWFETAEDYRAYHQDWDTGPMEIEFDSERFKGKGWYGLKTWEEPCGRGCCSNYPTAGVPGGELRAELFDKIEALEKKHDEIHDLLNTGPNYAVNGR